MKKIRLLTVIGASLFFLQSYTFSSEEKAPDKHKRKVGMHTFDDFRISEEEQLRQFFEKKNKEEKECFIQTQLRKNENYQKLQRELKGIREQITRQKRLASLASTGNNESNNDKTEDNDKLEEKEQSILSKLDVIRKEVQSEADDLYPFSADNPLGLIDKKKFREMEKKIEKREKKIEKMEKKIEEDIKKDKEDNKKIEENSKKIEETTKKMKKNSLEEERKYKEYMKKAEEEERKMIEKMNKSARNRHQNQTNQPVENVQRSQEESELRVSQDSHSEPNNDNNSGLGWAVAGTLGLFVGVEKVVKSLFSKEKPKQGKKKKMRASQSLDIRS